MTTISPDDITGDGISARYIVSAIHEGLDQMTTDDKQGPLTETIFYVLLALDTPLHGYGVMQLVNQMSDGRISLGAGTLYGALTALVEKGWIAPLPGADGDRKKEYVITELGRDIVRTELKRLEELLRNGQRVMEAKTR